MFSRAEKACLEALVEGPPETSVTRVARALPDPSHLRKLMWGVRWKVSASLAEWKRYAAGTSREERLLPSTSTSEGDHPVDADPLMFLLADIRRALLRGNGEPRADEAPESAMVR
jgi:hypothetical protein